jgi:uncharacterized protein (DUF1697 family)
METFIGMLRGVNVGGHNKIKMDALRVICESVKCENPKTHLQSGNVVFRSAERNLAKLSTTLETAIERKLRFRPTVMLRTVPELREIIGRNPFAKRANIEPSKLVVSFIGGEPSAEARKALSAMDIAPEEMHVIGRELYIYFCNGQARPKLSWARVDKILGLPTTSRNWNTVTKLLEMGEAL